MEDWKEIQFACRSRFAACFRLSSLVNRMKLFTYLQHYDVHLSQERYAVLFSLCKGSSCTISADALNYDSDESEVSHHGRT